jgi:hypothetical protein
MLKETLFDRSCWEISLNENSCLFGYDVLLKNEQRVYLYAMHQWFLGSGCADIATNMCKYIYTLD